MKVRGLVLDLDDTLYLERDFVRSGFDQTASAVEETGVASAKEVFGFLWSGFLSGRRRNSFDTLMARWPELAKVIGVDDLVNLYRDHRPSIGPSEPGVVDSLASMAVLGLITDGLPRTQINKLEALGMRDIFEVSVLTGEWGVAHAKPDHRAFIEIESRLSLAGQDLAYIADNPVKDFVAPNERGWLSIRIRMPGQLHEKLEPEDDRSKPRLEVKALAELFEII